MLSRLAWIPLLTARLSSAFGEGVETDVMDSVDPLRKIVRMKFQDTFPDDCWNPFQTLAHGYAEANDCVVYRARKKTKAMLELEILTKRKGGIPMTKDPILDKKQKKRGV